MKATEQLRRMGQSVWLDNITRGMIDGGGLRRYIDEFAVTGLTSNPTIFDHAIKNGADYDDAIRTKMAAGKSGEDLFFDLAIEDIGRAADLFLPVFERTCGVDGWVSLEVSPLLAYDTAATVAAAKRLHGLAGRPNVFIKIPGTAEGLPAIEEAIFAGVPINVTLLFSREHYLAAVDAYLRGIERRMAAGLKPDVASVASLFVSRWDVAVAGNLPAALRNRLGIAVARRTYKAYGALLASPRQARVLNAGARPQRLLMASTGTKDPTASDVMYANGLVAPLTVNTMPDATLNAFQDHGDPAVPIPADGGDCEAVLEAVAQAGIDVDTLAARLQDEGAAAFAKSWNDLLAVIAAKGALLATTGDAPMNVLAIDVGGTHVKILASGQTEHRQFASGPRLTAAAMLAGVKKLAADWRYEAVAMGYPGPVLHDRPVAEPHNLAPGWVGFDYRAGFGCPVKIVNDAAMQALGSYRGGTLLFLGLGTGLGSTLIKDGVVAPLELGHLPYRKGTYEDYVGERGLARLGRKRWRRRVEDVAARLIAALQPDDVVIGGGNVRLLDELPAGCRAGDNANAFIGAFRLWAPAGSAAANAGARPWAGIRQGEPHATRNDRTRPHGRQHGAAAAQRRA